MNKPIQLYSVYLALAILLGLIYQTKGIFDYEKIHHSKLEHKRGNRDNSDKLHNRKLPVCFFKK